MYSYLGDTTLVASKTRLVPEGHGKVAGGKRARRAPPPVREQQKTFSSRRDAGRSVRGPATYSFPCAPAGAQNIFCLAHPGAALAVLAGPRLLSLVPPGRSRGVVHGMENLTRQADESLSCPVARAPLHG